MALGYKSVSILDASEDWACYYRLYINKVPDCQVDVLQHPPVAKWCSAKCMFFSTAQASRATTFAGLTQVVLGQVDYQHPQMKERNFNEYMDDLSALVIYTALLALAIQPELWDRFKNTNLMFEKWDFLNPSQSELIGELQSINDTRLQLAVQELKKACLQPIDQVRFPFHIIGSLIE